MNSLLSLLISSTLLAADPVTVNRDAQADVQTKGNGQFDITKIDSGRNVKSYGRDNNDYGRDHYDNDRDNNHYDNDRDSNHYDNDRNGRNEDYKSGDRFYKRAYNVRHKDHSYDNDNYDSYNNDSYDRDGDSKRDNHSYGEDSREWYGKNHISDNYRSDRY